MEQSPSHSRSHPALRPSHLRPFLSSLLASALFFAPCLDATNYAASVAASAKDKKQKQDAVLKGLPITDLNVDEAILPALNRLAYGPRPGDIERIKQLGLSKWIDQQLNPNSIDDKAVESRLAGLPTLRLRTAKLMQQHPQPKQAAKQAALNTQELKSQGQSRSDNASAIVAPNSQ